MTDFSAWLDPAALGSLETMREVEAPEVYGAVALGADPMLWRAVTDFAGRLSPRADVADLAAALIGAGVMLLRDEIERTAEPTADPLTFQMRERAGIEMGLEAATLARLVKATLRGG